MLTTNAIDNSREEKTIVVSGLARGGTSMVSVVLRGLGIAMGVGLNNNHEDIEFYSILNGDTNPRATRSIIDSRNAQHKVWGFKSPLLVEKDVLQTIVESLRNPIVIMVLRNVVGNILSYRERDGLELTDGMQKYLNSLDVIRSFLNVATCPVVGINYEEAATHPQEFTMSLARILGVDVSQEVLDDASHLISGSGGGYVFLPEEQRDVEPVDVQSLGPVLRELACNIDLGSVLARGNTYVFRGDIFDGDDNLIKFSSQDDAGFGREVYFRVVFGENSYEMDPQERRNRTINIYFLLGNAYTLGVSFTLSYSDIGNTYRIRALRSLRGIAIGISNGKDKGVPGPAISLNVLTRNDRVAIEASPAMVQG